MFLMKYEISRYQCRAVCFILGPVDAMLSFHFPVLILSRWQRMLHRVAKMLRECGLGVPGGSQLDESHLNARKAFLTFQRGGSLRCSLYCSMLSFSSCADPGRQGSLALAQFIKADVVTPPRRGKPEGWVLAAAPRAVIQGWFFWKVIFTFQLSPRQ